MVLENTPVMDALRSARERHDIPHEISTSGVKTFSELFVKATKEFGNSPAYTCKNKTISFSDVDRLSSQIAAALQQRDFLQPGDRVAIHLPNILQYPVVAMAILKAGLVLVNVNPLYTDRE